MQATKAPPCVRIVVVSLSSYCVEPGGERGSVRRSTQEQWGVRLRPARDDAQHAAISPCRWSSEIPGAGIGARSVERPDRVSKNSCRAWSTVAMSGRSCVFGDLTGFGIDSDGVWACIAKNSRTLWSAPCKTNTFLARSIPAVSIFMDFTFRTNDSVSKFNHGRNCCRRLPPMVRGRDVPFIRGESQ